MLKSIYSFNPVNFSRVKCVTLPGHMLLLKFCTAGEREQVSPEVRRGKSFNLQKTCIDKTRSCKLNAELKANVVNTDK